MITQDKPKTQTNPHNRSKTKSRKYKSNTIPKQADSETSDNFLFNEYLHLSYTLLISSGGEKSTNYSCRIILDVSSSTIHRQPWPPRFQKINNILWNNLLFLIIQSRCLIVISQVTISQTGHRQFDSKQAENGTILSNYLDLHSTSYDDFLHASTQNPQNVDTVFCIYLRRENPHARLATYTKLFLLLESI